MTPRWFSIASVALLSTIGLVMIRTHNIDFKRPPGEVPQADVVRLARARDGVILVVSHTASDAIIGANTIFSALAIQSPSPSWGTFATLNELVPALPMWDVATDAHFKVQVVHERPGGAINAIMLRDSSGSEQSLTANYPLQSFSLPRFSRPSPGPPDWLTAVLDNRNCVAIPIAGKVPFIDLGACSEGLLVRSSAGFLFLYKIAVSGPVRGNSIRPGRLYLAVLDQTMHPLTKDGAGEVLGGSTMFEFDADIIDKKLVVVATTSGGIEVASGSVQGPAFSLVAKREYSTPVLMSPAVADNGNGKALIAALRSGTSQSGVVIAEVAISELGAD
jgi:hypothetical protein